MDVIDAIDFDKLGAIAILIVTLQIALMIFCYKVFKDKDR